MVVTDRFHCIYKLVHNSSTSFYGKCVGWRQLGYHRNSLCQYQFCSILQLVPSKIVFWLPYVGAGLSALIATVLRPIQMADELWWYIHTYVSHRKYQHIVWGVLFHKNTKQQLYTFIIWCMIYFYKLQKWAVDIWKKSPIQLLWCITFVHLKRWVFQYHCKAWQKCDRFHLKGFIPLQS